MKTISKIISIISASILCFSFCGCKVIEIQSQWQDNKVNIDGKSDEWANENTFIESGQSAISVSNDNEYLYVNLGSRDREMQNHILHRGIIVWFDPTGSKEKEFGIKFPIITQYQRDSKDSKRNNGNIAERLESLNFVLETLTGEKHKKRQLQSEQAAVLGIETKLGIEKGFLVYELKMPLQKAKGVPYSVNLEGSKSLHLGFETCEVDLSKLKNKKKESGSVSMLGGGVGRGMGGGGMRGGSGRSGGGRGGGRGGSRNESAASAPEQIEFWTKVTIAEKSVKNTMDSQK